MNTKEAVISSKMRTRNVMRSIVTPSILSVKERTDIARSVAEAVCYGECSLNGNAGERISHIMALDEWRKLRRAAAGSDSLFSKVFETVFRIVSGCDDLTLSGLLAEIERNSEIMELIGFAFPGNIEKHSEYLYNRFFSGRFGNDVISKLKDDLERIGEIMRFFISDLIVHPPADRNSRNMIIYADASCSMFGESGIISKAIIFSLIKRARSNNTKVSVASLSPNDASVLATDEDSVAESFASILLFSFGSGKGGSESVEHALSAMRNGTLKDTDIIFISKGTGVRNGIKLAREWETYRQLNDVRVFSVTTGEDGVGGLTELSDHIYTLNDRTVMDMDGHYSELIEDIG